MILCDAHPETPKLSEAQSSSFEVCIQSVNHCSEGCNSNESERQSTLLTLLLRANTTITCLSYMQSFV